MVSIEERRHIKKVLLNYKEEKGFIERIIHLRESIGGCSDILGCATPSAIVMNGFTWSRSEEGADYWASMYNRWSQLECE
jgi:hypothetical protein